jgi:hypothetical protein
MKAELKKQWLEALRSGKYLQGRDYLRSTDAFHAGQSCEKYCCLGVLVDIAHPDKWKADIGYYAFVYDMNWVGVLGGWGTEIGLGELQDTLIKMNDNGSTFAEIADWIEANIPVEEEVPANVR